MTHTEKLFLPIYIKEKEYKSQAVPAHGEGVNRQVDERGKCEQKQESFLQNSINCLPVILERSEESRQRMWVLNAFSDNLCRILHSL